MLSPCLGQLWPRRGQRHGILGWGFLDPPQEGRASGPFRASAALEMLGETKPPCPGRAFSPRGRPGLGALRKVSPPEPQPHRSAGCSALGPARPLRSCRLWATVRIKQATDPLATAPTLSGPSPHPPGSQLLGPSPGLPATAVHCPRVLPWGRGQGGAGGRSCPDCARLLLVGACLSWRGPAERPPPSFPSLALASGSTAVGTLGARQPPPTPHTPPAAVLASALPFRPSCLRGCRGLRRGQGSPVRGDQPQGSLESRPLPGPHPSPPHSLLLLRGCFPPGLAPCPGGRPHPWAVPGVLRGRPGRPAQRWALPPDRPSCAPGLGRRAVPSSEVWRAGLLDRLAGPRQ